MTLAILFGNKRFVCYFCFMLFVNANASVSAGLRPHNTLFQYP